MLNKPSWMTQEQYADLIKTHEQMCRICHTTDDLTVDHILSRAQGGKDHLDNYQILCLSHNASKGPRDDKYWGRDFYFDQRLSLENLRAMQRMFTFDKILDYAEWFNRPWSQISRRLYIIAGVVGAGKTLAIPVVAHALNFIKRRDIGVATRRVDKLLILTKEQGIRDQVVYDLQQDITKYNILPYAPRVKCVDAYYLIQNPEIIETADIWVSCIHMLYEGESGPKQGVEQVLARFPVICFDEPHWGTDQVAKLVDAASASLCFGFTGTPIDATGAALNQFVLLSLYGYQEAIDYDGSLKYLTEEETFLPEIIETVGFEEADVLRQGTTETIQTIDPQHIKNVIPARTIAERVIHYLQDCDHLDTRTRAARHRPDHAIPDIAYPMHAIICIDRVTTANALASFLNDKFLSNQQLYPRARGWYAEVVHSDREDTAGKRMRGKPITPNHPWLRCYKAGGILDSQCARILIVIGMGREGLNNPYCGVYGLTSHIASAVFIVQATIGRTLRAVIEHRKAEADTEEFHVPTERLDTPRILTHVAAQNERMLRDGLHFVLNMADHLASLPTIDDLIDRTTPVLQGRIEPDVTFTQKERYDIATQIGQAKQEGRVADPGLLVEPFRGQSPAKQQRVTDWIELINQSPTDAALHLYHLDQLAEAYIVTRELPTAIPTDDMLSRFIHRHKPERVRYLLKLSDPDIRELLADMYQDHVRQFHLGHIPAQTKLSTICRQFGAQLQTMLKGDYRGDTGPCIIAVTMAVRQKLGIPRGQKMRDGSQWDRAECHIMLMRDEVRREILGFGAHWLIKKGLCPSLAIAFQVTTEAWDTGEYVDDEETTAVAF